MEFSQNGLRVLAFAYKEVEDDHVLSFKKRRTALHFLGLVAMDPPRRNQKRPCPTPNGPEFARL